MNVGDTLITTNPGISQDDHLWVVVSDPAQNEDSILTLNLTTASKHPDKSCVLRIGDHPFITRDSCINYGGGYVNSHAFLLERVTSGKVEHREVMSQAVMERIWAGAAATSFIPLEQLELLREQGFVF